MWSLKFKEHMARGGEPVFAVDFQSPDLRDSGDIDVDTFVLHSHGSPGIHLHLGHAIEKISTTGQRVSVRSWKSSLGGLRVHLSGAKVAQAVSVNIPRGLLAELKVGFAGFRYDEFETFGFYVYRGLSGIENNWVMEFDEGLSILQRPSSVHLSGQFYRQAGNHYAELSTGYAGTAGETDLLVANAKRLDSGETITFNSTNFPKDSTHRGLLYVESTDTDPFFLKFTGIDGLGFEVVADNVLDTVRGPAGILDKVFVYGYVQDSIPEVANLVLFGRRDAHILSDKTMPDGWHCDLRADSHMVHQPDMHRVSELFSSDYANFKGDFIVPSALDNGFRGLEEFLSAFGFWLVMKEGRLSYRFVQQLVVAGGFSPKATPDYIITDYDIVREQSYQRYNTDAPDEIFQLALPGGILSSTVSETPIKTRPGTYRFMHPSRQFVFDDDVLSSNKLNSRTNMKGRLGPWYHRIPDQMTLELKSWRFAEMVPGDVVSIESSYLFNMINGALPMPDGSMLRSHRGTLYLVTGVDVNWDSFSVTVQLSTPPLYST